MTATNITHSTPKTNAKAFPLRASPEAPRKAGFKGNGEVEALALENAVKGTSVANYEAIFNGFAAKGIPMDEVIPRENVFTFNAWKALGRVVRRGESGVPVVTVIRCTKKDRATGEETPVRKVKTTTVFHVSQTEPLSH